MPFCIQVSNHVETLVVPIENITIHSCSAFDQQVGTSDPPKSEGESGIREITAVGLCTHATVFPGTAKIVRICNRELRLINDFPIGILESRCMASEATNRLHNRAAMNSDQFTGSPVIGGIHYT